MFKNAHHFWNKRFHLQNGPLCKQGFLKRPNPPKNDTVSPQDCNVYNICPYVYIYVCQHSVSGEQHIHNITICADFVLIKCLTYMLSMILGDWGNSTLPKTKEKQQQQQKLLLSTIYRVFNGDPYNGLLQSPHN